MLKNIIDFKISIFKSFLSFNVGWKNRGLKGLYLGVAFKPLKRQYTFTFCSWVQRQIWNFRKEFAIQAPIKMITWKWFSFYISYLDINKDAC